MAEATALVFMGGGSACARCHGHPTENWGLRATTWGWRRFSPRSRTKATSEWKEEIVYRNPKRAAPPEDRRGRPAQVPRRADGGVGRRGRTPRRNWPTGSRAPENPWFAKNIVNRIWYWLLGRGIVHEPDDMRPTNPPENPALLEYLAKELVGHHYDLKHIYRLVLNSKTYQLSSEPNPLNEKDVAHFSHYQAKRLTAEQILDALAQITEMPEPFPRLQEAQHAPDTAIPPDVKAAQIAEGSESSELAAMFGARPGSRDWRASGPRSSARFTSSFS